MSASVDIRRMREDEIEPLVALLERSWVENWGPHVDAAGRARFAAERPAKGYVEACWRDIDVAVLDGRVVGMSHLEGDYLHAIHVSSDAWGSGVGAQLMARAEAEGARRLEVRGFNARARAFYARRGWRETGVSAGTEMGTPVETVAMERG